ncbi:MAG: lysylphosphatidylglycerol synthase transmembrane domain-containing protein [Cyanobacteria bacterium P01_A01_bin.135]
MKRLISLVVSLGILALIYWKIDFQGLLQVFRDCDLLWMAISLLMVVPITAATAWRLQILSPPQARLSALEANRLILAASSLNMVLPSKMGDIAKAYFMRDRGGISGPLAVSLVIFEKACDMLSLLLWCAFGLLFYEPKNGPFLLMTAVILAGLILGSLVLASPRVATLAFRSAQALAPGKLRRKLAEMHQSWEAMHRYVWRSDRLLAVTGMSVGIWLLHLLQIWFFILALKAWVPFVTNLALSPLAILAGLLPLTFAGVGTRDAALIAFYAPFFNAQVGAALGLLCTSRYLLPAIAGLPFLEHYLSVIGSKRTEKV